MKSKDDTLLQEAYTKILKKQRVLKENEMPSSSAEKMKQASHNDMLNNDAERTDEWKKAHVEKLKNLLKIQSPSDIVSFKITEEWEDDDLLCMSVEINGVPVDFLYFDTLGFVEYWRESPRAFKQLKQAIKNYIEFHSEEGDW